MPRRAACHAVAQGNAVAESGDLAAAEAWFLKAHRPEAALAMYRDARRWEEAIRVAEAHLPAKVLDLEVLKLQCTLLLPMHTHVCAPEIGV